MNRVIKFRGLDEFGNWIYGGYFENSEEEGLIKYIFTDYNGAQAVYHSTVGQFAGLTDKNGNEIYEGDIVNNYGSNVVVEWMTEASCGCCNYGSGYHWSINEAKELEVMGNIHENPELLK